ncbi:MAG: PEP-CTERM sorting domain-containing protein [Desulfarculus sp.]|nr:PEP-CTERM sorting domain-containing protein [Desulfarculus sp.]
MLLVSCLLAWSIVPVRAASIEFGPVGQGGSFAAALDGGGPASGQAYVKNPDPHGGSSYGQGNAWGQYQGAGWLATEWQRVYSAGPYAGMYLWVDNFNVLEAIFGSDSAARQQVLLGGYEVRRDFGSLGVALQSTLPGKLGLVSDSEFLAAEQAGLTGSLRLSQIIFSAADNQVWKQTGYERRGVLTLVGLLTLGGEEYAFQWSLIDHDQGQKSLRFVLNTNSRSPQARLDSLGGSLAPLGGGGAVPEPGTALLLGSAAGLLAYWRRRDRRQRGAGTPASATFRAKRHPPKSP